MKHYRRLALVKRSLAMVLAIVMTVSGMPITANASSGAVNVNTAVEDELTPIVLEEEALSEEAGSTEVTPSEEGTTETGTTEMGTTETGTSEEESSEEESSTSEDVVKDVYEIRSNLDAKATKAEYTGSSVFSMGNILSELVLYKNGETYKTLNNEDDSVINTITYTWKDAEGKALETDPVNAGIYTLAIELPKSADDSYDAASAEIAFEITKASLTLDMEINTNIEPGTKVKDIAVERLTASGANQEFSYVIDNPDTEENEALTSDLAVSISVRNIDGDVVLGAEDALLKTEDYAMDITVTFTEEGQKAAAGNFVEKTIVTEDIAMETLIKSYVNVTLAEEWKLDSKITHAYTGKAITAPAEEKDYTVKVQYKSDEVDEEGNAIFVDIEDAKLAKEWYVLTVVKEYKDAEGNMAQELEWQKMEQAPVDAGKYVYKLSYDGKEGVYAESYTDIVVVIEPMKVAIKPVVKQDAIFYHEMSERDVLSQIDYDVVDALDNAKKVDGFDKTTDWGVSYDDNGKTQPYEPVFVLQYEEVEEESTEETTEEATETSTEESTEEENTEVIWVDNDGKALDADKTYRVIFSGYKAVYGSDGKNAQTILINEVVDSTDTNYMVDMESETTLFAEVEVGKGDATVIDISGITSDINGVSGKGDSLDNVYVEAFDKEPLYASKDLYKKAVVKKVSDGKEVAKGTDPSITYRWFVNENDSITDYYISDKTDRSYGEDEKNLFDESWVDMGFEIPYNAGIYKLQITYKDDTQDQYNASVANVYYVIEKKQIKASFAEPQKALTQTTVRDYLNRFYSNSMQDVSIVTVDENEKLDWRYGYGNNRYTIQLNVEQYQLVAKTDADGNPVLDESGNPVMEEKKVATFGRSSYHEFSQDYIYYLTADLLTYESNYTDEVYVIEDKTDENEKPYQERTTKSTNEKVGIEVEKMGENVLTVDVDTDKLNTTKVYDGIPFALSDILGDAVTVTTSAATGAEGEQESAPVEVTDVNLEYSFEGTHWYNDDVESYYGSNGVAVNAGTYKLYVSYMGDTTYAPLEKQFIAEVTITKKEITVTPVVEEAVVAGTTAQDLWNNSGFVSDLVITGYAEADKNAFTYQYYYDNYYGTYYIGYNAWYNAAPNFTMYDGEGNVLSDYAILAGEKPYTIKITSDLKDRYANNYDVVCEEATFETVRGTSTVESIEDELNIEYLTNEVESTWDPVAIKDDIVMDKDGSYTHSITTMEEIPYAYHTLTEDGSRAYGNFVHLRIKVPAEYFYQIPESAMYENSIEKAGGMITGSSNGYISVIFDASGKDKKEFAIRWEDGYTEEFVLNFDKSVLMGNLAEAVAPKTLAFNSPAKKMAVGEVQALDLKMTKVQMNDIVFIAYDVDNKDVLSVDDFGEVTALGVGSATVKAYPIRLVNGERVAIEGAKTASVKITVKDVTAPKIRKVTTIDDRIFLQYSVVPDGYRREIYVLDGKVTVDAFKDALDSMENQQWQDIFAIEPVYVTPENDDGDVYLYGLEREKEYTVYVRNVSAVRTLEDGSEVAFSTAGNVKSFTMTKAQVEVLHGSIKNVEPEYRYNPRAKKTDYYTVSLASNKVSVATLGYFPENASNAAADAGDLIPFSLPLDANAKKNYVDPKLTYAVFANYNVYSDTFSGKTNLATIDKKGNLKLKGVGTVYIRVMDNNTGVCDCVEVSITAGANKVKGNKVKLGVGEKILLEDLLTYYEGKKKLIGSYDRAVIVDDALRSTFENNAYFELVVEYGNTYVRAIQAGGTLNVALTDYCVQLAGGTATGNASLTSTVLAPVKNLKIANAKNLRMEYASLTDEYAYVQFNYTGGANAFRIKVADSRGKTIRSAFVRRENMTLKKGRDGKEYYVYYIGGLTQQSKYTVTATALYEDVEAKIAKRAFKTTKIPAADFRLQDYQYDQGLQVYVISEKPLDRQILSNDKYFVSGNLYTLRAEASEPIAEATGSDSLIWSSSNTKVATIKANPGTYTASFKAVKTGTTVIEIKSKVTKEVIARYRVDVASVGDAYAKGRRYYENNEPDRLDNKPDTSALELVLGETKYVVVNGNSEKAASYAAPKDAIYSFALTSGIAELYNGETGDLLGTGSGLRCPLSAGDSVFLKVKNTSSSDRNIGVRLTKEDYTTMSVGESPIIESDTYTWVEFKATKAGMYLFEPDADAKVTYSTIEVYENINDNYKVQESNYYGRCKCIYNLAEGQTVYLKVYGISEDGYFGLQAGPYTPAQLSEENPVTVKLDKGEYDWITFTVPETDYYTFTAKENSQESNASIKVYMYDAIGGKYLNSMTGYDGEYDMNRTLEKGATVYLKVSGYQYGDAADFTLSVKKIPAMTLEKGVAVAKGSYEWVSFTAPEAGMYAFEPAKDAGVTNNYLYIYDSPENGKYLGGNDNYYGRAKCIYTMTKGQKVYVYSYANCSADTYEMTVKAYTPESLSEEKSVAVKLDSYEYDWITFTAPETAYYTFAATENSEDSCIYVEFYETMNSNSTLTSMSGYASCEKLYQVEEGKTLYLRVADNNYSYDVDHTLSVKKMVSASMEDGVKVENEKYTWFSFTAPEAATYAFEPAADSGVTSSNIYLYKTPTSTNSSNLVDYDENSYGRFKVIYEMTAGETVYARVYGVCEAETYAVNVRKYTPAQLSQETNLPVVLGKGEYDWITFTASETAYYIFEATENSEDSYIQVKFYEAMNSNSSLTSMSGTDSCEKLYQVEEGKTLYLRVADDSYFYDVDHTLSVKKVVSASMEDGVKVENEKYTWFSFTAPETATYAFEPAADSGVTSSNIYLYTDPSNATDYIPAANNTNSYGRAKCIYTMTEGQTVYVRAYGECEAATYNVTVRKYEPAQVSEGTAYTVRLGKGEYDWLAFTPSETNYYNFKTVEKTEDPNAGVYVGFYKAIDGEYISDTYSEKTLELTAGETVYLKVSGGRYSYGYTAYFDLSVASIKAMSMTEGVEAVSNTNTWFAFTATDAGMYAFELAMDSGVTNSNIYLYKTPLNTDYDNRLEYNVNSYGRCKVIYEMTAGEKVYVRTYGECEAETYKVNVSKYTPTQLSEGMDFEVVLGKGEYEWITITPSEAEYYIFSAVRNAEDTSASIRARVYESMDEDTNYTELGGGYESFEKMYLAEADKTLYIKVTGYGTSHNVNHTMNVKAIPAMSLDTPMAADFADSTYTWASYTATDASTYVLEPAKDSGVTSSNLYICNTPENLYGSNVVASNSNDSGNCKVVFALTAGQKVYVRMYATGQSETGKVNFTLSKYVPDVITADTDNSVTLEGGEYEWLAFTPAQTGTYTIHATESATAANNARVYVGAFDAVNGTLLGTAASTANGNAEGYFEAQKDATVYLKVCGSSYDNSYTADFTFRVVKDKEITVGQPETVALAANENRWFAFTATEDGYYSFRTERTDETSGSNLYIYGRKTGGTVGSNSSDTGAAEVKLSVGAGQTVYLKVTGYRSQAANLQVSVTKVTTEELSLGTDKDVSLDVQEMAYYEYEVTEDGVYTIAINPNADADTFYTYAYIYSSEQSNNYIDSQYINASYHWEYALKAGETIYIATEAYYNASAFVLNVSKNTTPGVTEENAVTIAADTAIGWASFTAPATSIYKFSSEMDSTVSGDNYAYFYKATEDGSYYKRSGRNSIPASDSLNYSCTLKEGETVFWEVYNIQSTDTKLTVQRMVPDTVELTLDSQVDVTLQEGESKWILFEVPETGNYTFYSTGNSNSQAKGYLDSVDGTTFTAYYGGEGNNFKVSSTYLSKGNYLFINVKESYDLAAEFSVHVEKVE